MRLEDETILIANADERARSYLEQNDERRVFPSMQDLKALEVFQTPLPEKPSDPARTLELLDRIGTPGTTATNGPNYYGFVVGAVLPVAAATDRLAASWDQVASSYVNSPTMAVLEKTAGDWLLEILDLPREAGVGFGTSATACGLSCFATARAGLLAKLGWDITTKGLSGAPVIRVVVPQTVHVTIIKALKLLGFGLDNIIYAPVDEYGRIDTERLPEFDDHTIICLQAGEVNTGEFDDFAHIIPAAKSAGSWVHIDGAFGLWVRASKDLASLANGVELADSWTTDGHKSLNTSYDSAVAICRDKSLMAQTMNANAVYSNTEDDAQKNLTLEFSRRARGLGFWAVMHCLGREGIAGLISQYHERALQLADGCRKAGIPVLNRVCFNQILCGFDDEEKTKAFTTAVQDKGKVWFGPTIWQGKAAFRLSVSSWRTTPRHIDLCIYELTRALNE